MNDDQLKLEIAHIFESGANEIRVFDLCNHYVKSLEIPMGTSMDIYVSTDARPNDIYCAFTDYERAVKDCRDAGVSCVKVKLHFGERE